MSVLGAWVDHPQSEGIAADLEAEGAQGCSHGRGICYVRCGVRLGDDGWRAIPPEERARWYDRKTRAARSAARSGERVKAEIHAPGYVRFKAFGLRGRRYDEYKHASEGARYVRELRETLTPIDKVPGILVRLRRADFHVEATRELRACLDERDAREVFDLQALRERIERIDAELNARTGDNLFPYQVTGIIWLGQRYGALLADEMGLGKTVELITALPANAAVVVVAPAVAKGEWRGQLQRWRPQLKVDVLRGRRSFRWPRMGEVLVTNYDILPDVHDREGVLGRKCVGKLPAKPCPGCDERIVFLPPDPTRRPILGLSRRAPTVTVSTSHLPSCTGFLPARDCPGCHPFLSQAPSNVVFIFDEAQNLKSFKALRTQRASALSESVRARDGRVWLASGTPLENEPKELWSLLRIAGIAEEAFGSFDNFKRVFKARETGYNGALQWGVPEPEDSREHLQRVMLRRMKRDVLPQLPVKLPPSQYIVDLEPRVLRTVDEFLKASKKTVAEIVELIAMKDVEFQFMSSVRAALASAKIPALLKFVESYEERGEPLVVFSAHRAPIDVLSNRPGWVSITGDEDGDKKTRAADEFQHGFYAEGAVSRGGLRLVGPGGSAPIVEGMPRRVDHEGKIVYPRGIALTITSGGVAITLTRACHEVFVDRSWKPTANSQAEDRCVRIGQTRGVVITDLVGNHPLDARVTEVLVRKTKLIEASVDAAADGSDAPLLGVEDITRQFEETSAAIRALRAYRRVARTGGERAAVESLHRIEFDRRSDERIAGELARDASAAGLSDAQWVLALRLVERARARGLPERALLPAEPRRSATAVAKRSGWGGRPRIPTGGRGN